MPKPSGNEIYNAISAGMSRGDPLPVTRATENVLAMIDAAWESDAAERERGRKALEIITNHTILHILGCPLSAMGPFESGQCTCGLHAALASLREHPQASTKWFVTSAPPKWEDRTPSAVPDEDALKRENEQQRLRREGYAAALLTNGCPPSDANTCAARRYPLMKHVPKVISDPHGRGPLVNSRGKRMSRVYVGITPRRG